MAMDPELVADFLNEAQELVDAANADIAALEAAPDDRDVLNRMFRAFHTVKGGAGFIGITPMVDLCHKAEDLLSEVRAGKLTLDATGIDAVARALMQTETMLNALAQEAEIPPEPADIVDALHRARYPEGAVEEGEISEDDFEALLDQLHGPGGAPGSSQVAAPEPREEGEAAQGTVAEAPPPATARSAQDQEAQRRAYEGSTATTATSATTATEAKDGATPARAPADAPVRVEAPGSADGSGW